MATPLPPDSSSYSAGWRFCDLVVSLSHALHTRKPLLMMGTSHVRGTRGVFITFSGVDGAGKTTLLSELARTLEVAGHSVTCLHLYEDVGVFSVIRRIRRKWAALTSWQAVAPQRRGTPKHRPLLHSRFVTTLLLPFDILLFTRQRRHVLNRGGVLLIDRYFYDTLVDMLAADRWWATMLLRLMPQPDISVFVDVAPVVAFTRKGEFSVAELSRRADAYRVMFSTLPHATAIQNEQMEKAAQQLRDAVFGLVEGPEHDQSCNPSPTQRRLSA